MSFEDKSRHLYIWELAGLFALCAVLLSGLWAEGRQASIAGSLVRLHVLAVSDAPEEQAVKLRVRDAVLQCLTPRLADAHDADEAGAVLASSLDLIRSAAEGAAGGRTVHVSLGEERYPPPGIMRASRCRQGATVPCAWYLVRGRGTTGGAWCSRRCVSRRRKRRPCSPS